ncbi:hypothetical protein GLOTRDRAFT_109556 [Gloeophyllum trabeum ATCC 11539]|uniref:Uncharacterized protein n=1 Tax=Gloeophyllum trabeum (strain ATCC 11539 / FP-39264 / Madison 617) TaxID=670483 RepID=S7QIM4_GLOTA|nr:uncharacterized protein GLOTRDRAFT_109556 [Gloeophyllum trabeum ATCC 11539]EPQ59142.1 hypothetical protein GLOTRDRAFT_109556 [Gloeophyllum trabeum ATCC 11539]
MTTVDYRYDDPPFVATVTWDEFWEPNQEASNLQALKTSDSSPEVTKRRRFSDLVVDLALVIKRKCTVRSFLYSRKTPLSTLTNLDLAS